jgi:hypothetical protein
MRRLLDTMIAALTRLTARYPASPKVRVFRQVLAARQQRAAAGSQARTFAIQSVEDPFYFALFGAIVAELRSNQAAVGELVVVRAISGAIGVGWRARLRRSVPATWILSTQWVRAFAGLADRVAYRSHSWSNPLRDVADGLRSLAIWLRLRQQSGPFRLQIDGVQVDDLLTDSYLRFRPSPRFEPADPFVLRLIFQAHRGIRRARSYFRRRSPALYLTSYSTYLEHGIPVRVALQEGVDVFSFGNLTRFEKRLTLDDWFHTANCERYRAIFESLPDPQRRLDEAERKLRTRLSGGIDAATSYMKVSAYALSSVLVPEDLRGSVVVFLHDFYDSPHIYPDIVFDDFWRWACFTIDTLSRAGIPFYVKPHPNQVELSGDVMPQLKAAYPHAHCLPPGITNAQLAAAGVACGVTVYGTIAHELAYLGVPSVACARHPHIAFAFCRTARNVAEYADLLRSATRLSFDVEAMRREALAFYYMHNLYGDDADLELRARFTALWKACQDPQAGAPELGSALTALRQAPAFAPRVLAMLEPKDDGDR